MQTHSFYLRVALNHCSTVPETFGIQNFHSEQQQHISYQLLLFCTAFLPIKIETAKNKILANSLLLGHMCLSQNLSISANLL